MLTAPPVALAFVEEDRQRAKQGQHARGVGLPHRAAVFILGAVAPMPVRAVAAEELLKGQRLTEARLSVLLQGDTAATSIFSPSV